MSSESTVPIVEIGKVGKHPNADTLSITTIFSGYPVIFRTGDFNKGDRAIWVPPDMLVPTDHQEFKFLEGHPRIKAKRLRGIFSMGLLVPVPPELADRPVGANVMEAMGIIKYEPPIEANIGGECEKDPGFLPKYTDIDALRKYGDVLFNGESVCILEKIHGANFRAVWHKDRLWVGSHNQIKSESNSNVFWIAANQLNLSERLRAAPGKVFFGEVYGYVQDLRYGLNKPGQFNVRFFDIYSIDTGVYLDWEVAEALITEVGLTAVPILYKGPWKGTEAHKELAEGMSSIPDANCIKEGFVVKPLKERWDQRINRVVLKYHGEQYLLRKNK